MRKQHTALLTTLVIAAIMSAAAFPIPSAAYGIKYKTSGTYVDSAGGQHVWDINEAHTLFWDNDPYIPVGGIFTSRYISPGATDADYQADVSSLDAIKSGGITDIILKANCPITSVDPAALQKIIDYLDSNGFHYGIEMDDGPNAPLSGYLISPNRYRLEGPDSRRSIVCSWPDVDSAIYLVINRLDNTIVNRGGAVVANGKVTINLREPLRAEQVLIVYPHKTFKQNAMYDLWGGFGEYRDRVIAFFGKVKFGPGLRFFLEPFTTKMDFTGDMVSFLPDSSGFRLGLEAYLTRKYQHEGGVNSGWGMNDNLNTIEDATRLVPMWASGRGMPYAYNPASGLLYSIDVTTTGLWRDIVDYRDTSAQEYMNTISDLIRKHCANVPVIFKSDKFHRIYANPYGIGSYDGLSAQVQGTGEKSVGEVIGPVYSLAEESGKTTWYIATSTQVTGSSESAISGTLDLFREIGCKGFFAGSMDEGVIHGLTSFKEKLRPSGFADFKPDVIGYPVSITTGAYVKRLLPNTWWLPTLTTGKTSYIGDGLFAYTMAGEDRTYIWSSIGDKNVTIKIPPTGVPSVLFPPDARVSGGRGTFTTTLKDVPTVLKGIDLSLVFPAETAQAEIDILAALIPEADRSGFSVQRPRDSLSRAKTLMKNKQYMQAYGMAQASLGDLLVLMGADIWLEGELVRAENFDNVMPIQGASNALALVLDTYDDPPLAPYCATFTIDAKTNSSYELYIAATPPSDASPMSYTVDDINWIPVTAVGSKVDNYAPGLGWYKIGAVNLFPGKHILRLRADSRRASDSRYYFAIDALVATPRGFKPNGVIKPY
ncbi:hypothetical protein LLG46_14820 [bacterium]|nr:hypothetical protein [bacterium]